MTQKIAIFTFGMLLAGVSYGMEVSIALNKSKLNIGEPLVINVGFSTNQKINSLPNHKLLVDGKNVLDVNPLAKFCMQNFVKKNSSASYDLIFLINAQKDLFFNKEGKYSIKLEFKNQQIEESIEVKAPGKEELGHDLLSYAPLYPQTC